MKEIIYLVAEQDGKEDGNFVANYSIHREHPNNLQSGHFLMVLEIEHTDTIGTFVIMDENVEEAFIHSVVRLYTTKESLQKVIHAVRHIDGYNFDILNEVIGEIFKSENTEQVVEVLLF